MTGIDLNRAGTPLLEIVTEPDLRSSDEAVAYAKALHALVRWIGICDGNMQEGSFRCDANVSVRPAGRAKLGTRCEIKNLNSFRFMQQAIEFEVRRQIELIEDGGTVVQETRLYDPDRNETRSMRSKEDAQDYRYFPDPDLPPLVIGDDWIERVRAGAARAAGSDAGSASRAQYALPAADATALTASPRASPPTSRTSCARSAAARRDRLAANWVLGERRRGAEPGRDRHRPRAGVRRRGSPACCRASPTARSPARSPRTCSTRCGPASTAATPTRSSRRGA